MDNPTPPPSGSPAKAPESPRDPDPLASAADSAPPGEPAGASVNPRPSLGPTLASASTATAPASGPPVGLTLTPAALAPKPSYASINTTASTIQPGGPLSAKPSYASLASTKGLLGSSAPIAGFQGHYQHQHGPAKPALEDLPESPASPGSPSSRRWSGFGGVLKKGVGAAGPPASSPGSKPAAAGPGKVGSGVAGKAAPGLGAAAGGGQQGQKPLAKKEQVLTFLRIFSYTTAKDRLGLALTTLAAAGSGSIMPLSSIVFGRLVTAVTSFSTRDLSVEDIAEKFTLEIRECVLYMVYLFIGKFVFTYFAMLGFRTISLRISATLRLAYITSLLAQPISFLDAVPPGLTAATITSTTNTLQLGVGEKLASLATSASLILSALLIAFLHSWKLTLVTCSGLVVIAGTYGVTVPLVVKGMKAVEDADLKAAAVAAEAFATVRMVKACGAEGKMGWRYGFWARESRRRGVGIAKVVAVQQCIVFFTVFATFALAFFFSVKLYLNSGIPNVGTLIIVLMSVMMIVMSIGGISAPISAVVRSTAAATTLFKTIDLPRRDTSGKKPPADGDNNDDGGDDGVSAGADIVVSNVNFTYPARPHIKVLAGVNLTFPAGKTTAIVGPSGSGKSTIVGLLERWYELDGDFKTNIKTFLFRNGKITCGGIDLKDMDLRWWRSQIGLVQQEPFLFNGTIQGNIEHGLIGTQWENEPPEVKLELVQRACQEAFADEFIARLPDGLQTQVGDSGTKLSGGQRQRLAIARALIRRPKILILDEATSAIDVRSEHVVQAALDAASRNRTTIAIAHRLSTVRRADNIVVLAKGKVVQQGTHEALMAQVGGAYWTLATAQRVNFGDEAEGVGKGGLDGGGPTSFLGRMALAEKQRSMDIMESDGTTASVEGKNGAGEEHVPKGFFGSFGALIVEQGRRWPWYTALLFGALIAGASTPVQAYIFAQVLSGFYLWGEALREWVNFWCIMFVALAGAVAVGYFTLGWSATSLAFKITATYRKEYFANILAKPIPFHDLPAHTPASLTALVATDPTQLQQLLGTNMGFALISVLAVAGCIALSFYFGWKLALAALGSSLPVVLAAGFLRLRYEARFERANRAVFAASAKYATEAVGACRTVAALTMEADILEKYERLLEGHVEGAWRGAKYSTLIFAASDGVPLLCMAFVLWYGGKLLAEQEYYPFQYLVVYMAVVQGGMSAGQWLSFAPNIAQATAAANRILASRKQYTPPNKGPVPSSSDDKVFEAAADDESGVRLEFSNVWFRYPTRDAPVLNGLNLTIEKGQFVGIVGASGAGKTSIISLLERFYTVNAGSITYNDKDITTLPLAAYRRSFSLVAQEPNLFTGTIRENILAGLPSDPSTVPDATVHSVCASVGIHDFIASLPEGYQTRIGLRGVLLSGGQRQRIAIARALIRDPKVLLLDEATASLDSESERGVQRVFDGMKGRRTMVVVAHRLTTVQNADVIYVLGEGQVVEKGSHGELLARKGMYYHMCLAQALDR